MNKTRYADIYIYREREIGTKDVMYYVSRTTITKYNNQPLLKVTKSLYIVIVFTKIA